MVDNALRCTEADYPALLGLAVAMGVVTMDGQKVIPSSGIEWDYIGHKRVGAPPGEGQADNRQILKDSNNNKYVHINVRTPFSIGEAAAQLAQIYPEIGSAMANPGRFFVVDGQGNSVQPEVPMRVFL